MCLQLGGVSEVIQFCQIKFIVLYVNVKVIPDHKERNIVYLEKNKNLELLWLYRFILICKFYV